MKNTGSKILILGAVIALAAAGVLVFYPTIVAPPTDVPVENLHKASLENDIIGFSKTESSTFNDSIYNTVINKLELYRTEKFLSEENLDYETKTLVQKYLPIFSAQCYKRFQASIWRESDHKAMLSRISNFRKLKVDNGETSVIVGTFKQDLENIEYIISQYSKAKAAAKHSSFYSVNDANEKIKIAESYKTADYLKNCTELVNGLSEVKVKIGLSHFNKVAAKVEEMRDYKNMSEEYFDVLVSEVNKFINEYIDNRPKYGLSAKKIDSIKDKANHYYKEARLYYQELNNTIVSKDSKKVNDSYIETNEVYDNGLKKSININPGQWIYMKSPVESYRAFQSNSNYHVSYSSAMMSFTISGYESFEFYIRSNGEADHDYVIVGIDKVPTIDSNYASTKGSPSSGSSFYNYKAVTVNNLDKTNSYIIYIIYRKDGAVNKGTDRGYVLIPIVN